MRYALATVTACLGIVCCVVGLADGQLALAAVGFVALWSAAYAACG